MPERAAAHRGVLHCWLGVLHCWLPFSSVCARAHRARRTMLPAPPMATGSTALRVTRSMAGTSCANFPSGARWCCSGSRIPALIITSGRCRQWRHCTTAPTSPSSAREWCWVSSRFRAACRACSTIGLRASFPPRRFSTRWSGGGSGAITPRSTCRCSSSPVSIAFQWWRSMSSVVWCRASGVRAGRRCRRTHAKGSPIRRQRAKAICAT